MAPRIRSAEVREKRRYENGNTTTSGISEKTLKWLFPVAISRHLEIARKMAISS